jgi:hypothetical protein
LPLSRQAAVEQVQILLALQRKEREKLDKVRKYWKGKQDLPLVIPSTSPREVKAMAKMARVNVCEIVVDSLSQSLSVTGFRAGRAAENAAPWSTWQSNRLDARQSGVHRAALAYGASYLIVLPGDPVPVMRGTSPRGLTTLYGEDPDWPIWALERWDAKTYRLYDDEAVYFIGSSQFGGLDFIEARTHDMGVCPVVRFLDAVDLDAGDDIEQAEDDVMLGQVAPLINLQDQIDLTSFNLLVAQHYTAFRQRYAIGWVPKDDEEKMTAAASRLWTFDKEPSEMQLGEFAEGNLDGYIKAREAMVKYAATLSQTPVHELIGEIVNLSAEALAAAEAGHDRKSDERKTGFGESWEQGLQLVGQLIGSTLPDDVQVRWKDTSARAFGALVDALGKLAQMLGIPPEALWERLPDVTDQDIKSWKALAAERPAIVVPSGTAQ